MARFFSRPVLFLALLLSTVLTQAHAGQKIALGIFLADEIAYRTNHAYYMKDLFARLLPGVEYKQILVPVSLMGLHQESARQKIIQELRKTVAADDVIEYLVLDTHGNTIESNGKQTTTLAVLGHVGPDQVDAKFDQIFSGIKNQTASNLTVILNSCSTFCGPATEAEKRAATFLKYFSASNGRIYGAYVKEVDSIYLDPKAFKLRALLPSWKIYLTTVALFGAAFGVSPLLDGSLQSFEMLKASLHGALYFGLPFATLIETLSPLFSWFAGKTFANRGLFFSYQNGKLQSQIDVQKPRDLKKMLLKGTACESVHF